MFDWFFKAKKELPKFETWKKFQLFELFDDLDKAKHLLSELIKNFSEDFTEIREFYSEYVEELNDLNHQNVPDFERICIWFAPTSDWDDFTGKDGMELGNRIYEKASKWNKATQQQ